jgi:hypothetical protein
MARDAKKDANEGALVQALIQTAVEMQNSFTDMKRLLAQTRDEINDNTDRTVHKAINGPRPYPGGPSRAATAPYGGGGAPAVAGGAGPPSEDVSANLKKQGIFRRALKGLGNKGSSDLGRIEDMFNQLLCEVDMLKAQGAGASPGMPMQMTGGGAPSPSQSARPSSSAVDRHMDDEGQQYPDGGGLGQHSRNPSTAGSAMRLTNTASPQQQQQQQQQQPQGMRQFERKYSDLRISTVPEGNEEPAPTTPSRRSTPAGAYSAAHARGNSVPIGSPVDMASPIEQSASRATNDKNRKTKSSSWFPKISRWSETTTSSVQRVFRSSANSSAKRGGDPKDSSEWAPARQPSRSASSLNDDRSFDDDDDLSDLSDDTDGDSQQVHSVIDPYGDENVPPTPYSNGGGAPIGAQAAAAINPPLPGGAPGAMPRGYTMTPEDPKYKAHRNSLNLQHPQPRTGQTERFRNALEYSAQDFMPSSPRSEAWGGSMTSINRLPPNANQVHAQSQQQQQQQQAAQSQQAQQAHNQIRYVETQLQPLQTEPNWRAASPAGSGSAIVPGGAAPPRPPKEPIADDHATPRTRVPRQKDYTGSPQMQMLQNRNLANVANSGAPARRPSGPRAMTPKNDDEPGMARDERQRKRNTFGALVSHEGY